MSSCIPQQKPHTPPDADPLYDLTVQWMGDEMLVGLEELWDLFHPAMKQLSVRYHQDENRLIDARFVAPLKNVKKILKYSPHDAILSFEIKAIEDRAAQQQEHEPEASGSNTHHATAPQQQQNNDGGNESTRRDQQEYGFQPEYQHGNRLSSGVIEDIMFDLLEVKNWVRQQKQKQQRDQYEPLPFGPVQPQPQQARTQLSQPQPFAADILAKQTTSQPGKRREGTQSEDEYGVMRHRDE